MSMEAIRSSALRQVCCGSVAVLICAECALPRAVYVCIYVSGKHETKLPTVRPQLLNTTAKP